MRHARARITLVRPALLAAWVAISALGLGLGGCTSGRGGSVAVELRDAATGAPIEGAVVRALPQNPKHVFRVADYLRAAPGATSVRTDAGGRAVLELPADRPFELVVAVSGREPESISFEGPGELMQAARVWLLPPGAAGAGNGGRSATAWGVLRCAPVAAAGL